MIRGESKQDPFPPNQFPPEAILEIARSTERRKQRRKREFYHFMQLPPELRRMICTNILTLQQSRPIPIQTFCLETNPPLPLRPISHLPTNLTRSKTNLLPTKLYRYPGISADLHPCETDARHHRPSLQVAMCLTQRLRLVEHLESSCQMLQSLLS